MNMIDEGIISNLRREAETAEKYDYEINCYENGYRIREPYPLSVDYRTVLSLIKLFYMYKNALETVHNDICTTCRGGEQPVCNAVIFAAHVCFEASRRRPQ